MPVPHGSHDGPGAATAPSARRRSQSAARIAKKQAKFQLKWLERRCEAAANKTGGSPPRVLGCVLRCCGRFRELLEESGHLRMLHLRRAEAAAARAVAEEQVAAQLTVASPAAEWPPPVELLSLCGEDFVRNLQDCPPDRLARLLALGPQVLAAAMAPTGSWADAGRRVWTGEDG